MKDNVADNTGEERSQNNEDDGYQSSSDPGEAPLTISRENTNDERPVMMGPADQLLKKALNAHGGERYFQAEYVFAFRKKDYRFKNDGKNYRYESTSQKDGSMIVDVLENGQFSRTIDGQATRLTPKQIAAGTESLNSVIYFATLPAKLTDPAVNLEHAGPHIIKGQRYETLQVSFDEEGGGNDHDDNFRYWINEETGRIDYLAYDYTVNGGGVRFRSAYNPRVVDGILFQDYVNYKAPLGTDLSELPMLYASGKLEELSRIETEDVVSLN
ncbi:hypothetical protein CEQ90_07395 [Lewinellaceae bacterium SD302]|nr:hypothetical protein CEQ90_07395 [Lewinellaceae bacterium SD302]